MDRADIPKTDRELLLQIHSDLGHLNQKIVGVGGICETVQNHDNRICALENWRWYIFGGIAVLTFALVAFGRYIDLGGI